MVQLSSDNKYVLKKQTDSSRWNLVNKYSSTCKLEFARFQVKFIPGSNEYIQETKSIRFKTEEVFSTEVQFELRLRCLEDSCEVATEDECFRVV